MIRDVTDSGLDGRRALVTGAGQGVGEAIARELAAAGCHVLVNDFVADRAQAVADDIVKSGGSATSLPFDVTDYAAINQVISAAGPVHILVNNAGNAGTQGFGEIKPFVETSPADWTTFIDVNLYGVMNCSHAVLPAMIEAGWGRVITIVSDAGRTGGAPAAYGAAKAAAAGFSRVIARDVARHGVTVNSIALGTMRTPVSEGFWADPANEKMQRALMSDYLVRRPGDPDDVAWMVCTLASPRASWITGQTIAVNGGFSFTL
jgi:NAD(P)-dependent dehydrogenase (short-subunit alcohol dehydrogenase family)